MASNEGLVPVTGNVDQIIEVGRLKAKGKSDKSIAMELDLKPREVAKMAEQYRTLTLETAKNNQNYADRLSVALEESLEHFNMLLKDAWENKDNADLNQEFSVVNSSLRLIKDINVERHKMIQSMTQGQDAELLAELEEMEEQHEMLIDILKELKENHPDAAKFVHRRLAEMRGVQVV